MGILSRNGVRAIAIRAAGYNNVDIRAAYHNRITVFMPILTICSSNMLIFAYDG